MPVDDQLIAELAALRGEVEGLRDKVASLERENITLSENQIIQLRLIGQLREGARKEPQPLQKDRADILRALLATNGGKMLAKDARQKMHLSKELFSMLIASMKDDIESKALHSDKRKLVLTLK